MSTPIARDVDRVDRVLGVDEDADAAQGLGLGDDVVDQRRLSGGLRAEDLDDPAPRHAADTEREVERQRHRSESLRPGTLLSAPSRISEPSPKSRSIWVTAASRAASLALASFAETSFKGRFLICHLFLHLTAARLGTARLAPAGCIAHPAAGVQNGRASPGRKGRALRAFSAALRGAYRLRPGPSIPALPT